MSYYRICPYCGAALYPGEKCDCGQKKPPALQSRNGRINRIGKYPNTYYIIC